MSPRRFFLFFLLVAGCLCISAAPSLASSSAGSQTIYGSDFCSDSCETAYCSAADFSRPVALPEFLLNETEDEKVDVALAKTYSHEAALKETGLVDCSGVFSPNLLFSLIARYLFFCSFKLHC